MFKKDGSIDQRKITRSTAEIIVFNGIKFYRYPDSPYLESQRYFSPGIMDRQNGVESLHREVWKSVHGPIPEGSHIHHSDGNFGNNAIENLECLTPQEHAKEHGNTPRTARQIAHLESMRSKALAWHTSEANSEWHKAQAELMREAKEPQEFVCEACHASYVTIPNGRNKFCSIACHSKHRKIHTLVCAYCHHEFQAQSTKQECCSRTCANRKRYRDKLESSAPVKEPS